ncbi:MAG: DUF928 domain-containing protein [Kaiparowitsia implicata GSE-PSE-MK54-09C]|jgi:hypothetical protein|nr:DUF928 domain-containing protein [Kaiparowitsia implicata GSE-PSE-MK54-09C]
MKLSWAIALVLAVALPANAQAQAYRPPAFPPNGSPSGQGTSGASRGECPPIGQQAITALVPTGAHAIREPFLDDIGVGQVVWATTTRETPTLWFYTPYELSEEIFAEFSVLDSEGNLIYRLPITYGDRPGIVAVHLDQSLQVGEDYKWVFSIYCTADDPLYVFGWIQQTTLPLELEPVIANASPLQQATIYAEHGFWHDALTILATARRDRPSDSAIAQQWHALLESVELEHLSDVPVLP